MLKRVWQEVQATMGLPLFILTALIFLLPVFFIPFSATTLSFSKTLLFGLGMLGVFGIILVRDLRDGNITLPINLLTGAALLLALAYLFTAIVAPAPHLSLMGQGYETDTAFFIMLLMLTIVLTALACRTKGGTAYTFVALFATAGLLGIIQAIRLIDPSFFSFGFLTARTASLMGTWNDLGIFFGLGVLFAWLSLEHLMPRRYFSGALWGLLALSLVLLATVNFVMVWMVLGFFASLSVAYRAFPRYLNWPAWRRLGETQGKRRISRVALIVMLVSLLFTLDFYSTTFLKRPNTIIGNFITTNLNLVQLEARPSWQTTATLVTSTYRSPRALVGTGPNTFGQVWLREKPASINQTIFWNTPFSFAVGFIPTSFVTTGILGAVAWLLFIGAFLWLGFRAFVANRGDTLTRYLTIVSYVLAGYLWLFSILYVPGVTLLVYAALFTGVFLALLYQTELLTFKSISLTAHPRGGFAFSLFLIVLLIGTVAGVYTLGRKFAAAAYFDRSVKALSAQNLDDADVAITRAIAIAGNDRYEQLAAQVGVARLNAALGSNANPSPEERESLRQLIVAAIGHARAATDYDKNNYYNWITLGQIYEALARLNIEGAAGNALSAYEQALVLNPQSPAIALARARLSATAGEYKKASKYIDEALGIKADYTAAILLRAQIEIARGDTKGAVASLSAAAQTSPNNPLIFFELGFLSYSVSDNKTALAALERAVSLDENYSNARYFLGLSYYRVGRSADAIVQFERIRALNPDNTEVQTILNNLHSGKSPLSGISTPPEKRREPPLDE